MKRIIAGLVSFVAVAGAMAAHAAEAPIAPAQEWSFSGLFGTYDRGSLQRGLKVYREVCASCHSLDLIAFRNLEGLGFTAEQVAGIASQYEVEDGPNEDGEMFLRSAKASDRFPAPFPNEQAARAANSGAYPPDLSLIIKARAGESVFKGTKFRPYGADYVHALLTSYHDEAPDEFVMEYKQTHDGAEFELLDGLYFNEYFAGNQVAMAPPLYDEGVEFADGTAATVSQQAHDVATFLAWASDPGLEERKRLGIKVILFLIVLTAMLYALKRKIWSDLH